MSHPSANANSNSSQSQQQPQSKPSTRSKRRRVQVYKSTPLDYLVQPARFDLANAIQDLAEYEGESTRVNLYRIPNYVCAALNKMRRRVTDILERVTDTECISACLEYGLSLILDSEEYTKFSDFLEAFERGADYGVLNNTRMYTIINSLEFTPLDGGMGLREVPMRCRLHPDISSQLFRVTNDLRTSISHVAIPCIMKGMAYQPGIGERESLAMTKTFDTFLETVLDHTSSCSILLEGVHTAYERARREKSELESASKGKSKGKSNAI